MIELSAQDKATLEALETSMWVTSTRFDGDYMEQILSTDFFEFGRSGKIHSRADCLSVQAIDINTVTPLPNLTIRLLTADVAQVTYNSEVTCGDATEKGRRSSIWTKTEGAWQLRFHQGTAFT